MNSETDGKGRSIFRLPHSWCASGLLAVLPLITPSVHGATAADFLSATVAKTGVEPNDLPYRYFVPAGYAVATSYPLIVFLHGSSEQGNNNSSQLTNNANGALQLISPANQVAFPCFMLAPQANSAEGWNANTLGEVMRAIAQLRAAYSIDPDRIYVTGLSMGGAGTWDIINRYPFTFAAAVPMSGWGAGTYERIVGIPIWAFHSVDDPTVAVTSSDSAVGSVRQLGGHVIYTRFATGGHAIWPTAYNNPYLLPWIMAQRRNQPASGAPIVTINSPPDHLAPPPATTTKSVSGSASIPGGITKVNWTFNPSSGNGGVSTSGYSLASGTASWTVTNAAVTANSSLFLVVATGPSWATGTGTAVGGGETTLNDYFWNVPTGANVTVPSIVLATPTATGSFTTQGSTVNLSGTAAAAGTKTIKAVTWRNNRGGEGSGLGGAAWNIDTVGLQSGDNILTITARDSNNITASTTLTVHVTPDGGNLAPAITAHPSNQSVTEFQSATFAVTATGTGVLAYQWRKDGNPVAGATSATLKFASAKMSDAGVYDVVVSSPLGSATSGAAILAVAPSVNGGGHADILWQNRATGQRSAWLLKGTTFSAGVDLGTFTFNWQLVATGDFNADNRLDILWQNIVTGECSIWLMNGTVLAGGVVLPTQQDLNWRMAATGDFNGDGKVDILWQNIVTGQRRVWLMNGTVLGSVVDLGTQDVSWQIVASGDFDGDGKADILWQNTVTGQRTIWLMNGTTLNRIVDLVTENINWQIVTTADFNGDDQVDILWQNTVTGQRRIWMMNGTTLAGTVDLGTFDLNWQMAAAGDIDADGRAYHLRPLANVPLNAVSDFFGDDRTNIIWQNATTGEHNIWLMNGTAPISGANLVTLDLSWKNVGTGDFNHDGKTDLLWQNTSTGQCSIWLMNGKTLNQGIDLGTIDVNWRMVATGDFNGDGELDILWQNLATGQRSVWLMKGTTMLRGVDLGTQDVNWQMVATADFDGDGKVDILWQNHVTGQRRVWLMNGLTLNRSVDLGTIDVNWQMVAAGDFNGDGKPDIVWQNIVTGQVSIWLMNGTTLVTGVDLGIYDPSWVVAGLTSAVSGQAPKTATSEAEAARFLIQSSFGPTASSVARVRSLSYAAWIDEQMAMTPTYHLPYFHARVAELVARDGNNGYSTPRQEAWWQYALTAPDQLRQRMAFALSEILVISQVGALDSENEGVTAYYDLLLQNAFGNYRTLLGQVTLSPMMGTYLSMIRNRKPDPVTGSQPDENFARECMQLFTIGLSELNLDGTPRLGADGRPIPTYTQDDIVGLAHVFTGWGSHFDPANPPHWDSGAAATANDWFLWGWDPLQPMTFNTKYGDLQARQIVGKVTVPATLTGPQRLALALDTLFNHPSTAPFISRQLIQRFVTSNPSPAYVYRVASVFANNGSGVRGDLGATLKALLLDPEARRPESIADATFGKAVEPLIRQARLLRAFPPVPPPHAATGDMRLFLNFLWDIEEQAPLMSPSVFNFFRPNFAQPGKLATAGLVSPEFQIFSDTTVAEGANRNFGLINWGLWINEPSGGNGNSTMDLDLREPLSILTSGGSNHALAQATLVEYFNQRLLGGGMSSFLRQKILDTYASLPKWFDYSAANEMERVQVGLFLVTFSPEFNIQH